MAQAAHAHDNQGHGGGDHGAHHPPIYYIKIWAILLVLLFISIMGPMLGNKVLTIVTAFGIAIIKALMVGAFFMHLNVEKRYIWYLLFGMMAMLAMFWFGVAADVNKATGRNWTKVSIPGYVENFKKQAEELEGAIEAKEGGAEHAPEGAEAPKEAP